MVKNDTCWCRRQRDRRKSRLCKASFALVAVVVIASSASTTGVSGSNFFSKNVNQINFKTTISETLTRSMPALTARSRRRNIESSGHNASIEVSTRTKKKKMKKANNNKSDNDNSDNKRNNLTLPSKEFIIQSLKPKQTSDLGFFYGVPNDVIPSAPETAKRKGGKKKKKKKLTQSQQMLRELREMKKEMQELRKELSSMKQKMGGVEIDEKPPLPPPLTKYKEEVETEDEQGPSSVVQKNIRQRQREFDKLGREVEQWAERCLFKEDEKDGWKEILCNNLFKNKYNKDNTIKAYSKWMKDSRGPDHAKTGKDANEEYPCMKVYATIDAPLEDVCSYLANEDHVPEYNELLVNYRDLEEITPHSKICWAETPQVLFIKSREFVTFCHHRWLRDGTQVVVNQACDHPDAPSLQAEKEGKACRGYALRGANFISRHPDDSNKTRICLIAHGDPGNLPRWAVRTAFNAAGPIELFKLFYNINSKVQDKVHQNYRAAVSDTTPDKTEMVSSMPGRSSNRPAGLSQLGYACFWPSSGDGKNERQNNNNLKMKKDDNLKSEQSNDAPLSNSVEEKVKEQSPSSKRSDKVKIKQSQPQHTPGDDSSSKLSQVEVEPLQPQEMIGSPSESVQVQDVTPLPKQQTKTGPYGKSIPTEEATLDDDL